MNKTAGVLTTQKIRALIDSKQFPQIRSRSDLATALTVAGSPITVHGVDAWFKHVDSNYALARRTLDSEHPSYAVPKSRWIPILRLFELTLDHIEVDDGTFRRQLFNSARQKVATATLPTVLARCWSPAVEGWVKTDEPSLQHLGFKVVDVQNSSRHSDWSIERRLSSAQCGLLYLNPATVHQALASEVLSYASSQSFPLAICWDGEPTASALAALDFPVVQRNDTATGLNAALCATLGQLRTRTSTNSAPMHPLDETPVITQRPSIAVLPFADFTGDQKHQRLGLALADDITTLLSRLPELFVVSSSSTRIYQNQLPDTRTVRDQLGVRYILEGSIRTGHDNSLRVTAQLVDAVNRRGLWGERYDKLAANPHTVLDELSVAICAQLEPRIRLSEISEAAQLVTAPAWQQCQEGWMWLYVDGPKPKPVRSLELFAKALEQDSSYPLAHAGMAVAISTAILWGGESPAKTKVAKEHALFAYERLPQNGATLYAMAMVHFVQAGSLSVPMNYLKEAVAFEPSNPMYHAIYGYLLAHSGAAEEGLERCRYAMKLSPVDASETFLCYMLGNAQIATRDFEAAINTMRQCVLIDEVDFVWLMIAYAHFGLGQITQCRQCLEQIKQPRPLKFYLWAVNNRLWMGHSEADKAPFAEIILEWAATWTVPAT